jgi:hypothetical protein
MLGQDIAAPAGSEWDAEGMPSGARAKQPRRA